MVHSLKCFTSQSSLPYRIRTPPFLYARPKLRNISCNGGGHLSLPNMRHVRQRSQRVVLCLPREVLTHLSCDTSNEKKHSSERLRERNSLGWARHRRFSPSNYQDVNHKIVVNPSSLAITYASANFQACSRQASNPSRP